MYNLRIQCAMCNKVLDARVWNQMPLFGCKTDGVIYTGLAPEIPEDLYMLIKKV
jgi:hypothetical protein